MIKFVTLRVSFCNKYCTCKHSTFYVYATQKSRQGMSLFKYLGTYISVEHVQRVFDDN